MSGLVLSAGRQSERQLRKAHFLRIHHDAMVAACILAPMMLWWVASNGFPTFFGFFLGFFEWKNIDQIPRFIGLGNFVAFFSNQTYLSELWRTIWLGGICTLLTVTGGFAAALLMNLSIMGKGIYRTLWYVPAVTSPLAITQVMNILLNPIDGVVNKTIAQMGLPSINWSESLFWNVMLIILYSVWKGIGGAALVWLAGLQSVDPALYEAAEVDGAGKGAKFLHITLPGLKPIATYIIITGIIGAMQIYEPVAFISNGGPSGKTMVLALRIIKDGFFNFNFGMAGASGMVLAIIVFTISVSYYKFSQKD